ncbi:MAG: glycosyltransferase family 4 protein [Cyclobacteriaceae bacterium]|nr:glycosyltransferase family 4 protein [Cyclobacteriaceae bacterium]
MKHLVYVISHVEKSLAFEWVVSRLAREYRLTVILLNPSSSAFESFLTTKGISVMRIAYRSKADFPMAFLRTFLFFLRTRPEVVHAHLLDAQLVGLSAAWLAGIRKRIYTRHTSTFHHAYHPKGVRYDRMSNRLATHIISVSQATDHALIELEHVIPAKIFRIPHGFELERFSEVSHDRLLALRSRWSIQPNSPIVGVVARLIEWKGVDTIVKAFAGFQLLYPESQLILCNASGPAETTIRSLIAELGVKNVTWITFEEDAPALYRSFDIVVHAPVDLWCEAFGQVYIEAMASGVPMVVTRSGIAEELVNDHVNALVVPFRDAEAITRALVELWKDEELRKKLVRNARQDVVSQFGMEPMISALKRLYDA